MNSDFSVQNMSLSEKLVAMEKLWESLRSLPDGLTPPDWHQAVLEDRDRRLRDEEATVSSLKDVTKRIEELGQ